MTEIIIRGRFEIEGLAGFDNVRFPLKFLKLKVFPTQPYVVESFSSCEDKEKPLGQKGCGRWSKENKQGYIYQCGLGTYLCDECKEEAKKE